MLKKDLVIRSRLHEMSKKSAELSAATLKLRELASQVRELRSLAGSAGCSDYIGFNTEEGAPDMAPPDLSTGSFN